MWTIIGLFLCVSNVLHAQQDWQIGVTPVTVVEDRGTPETQWTSISGAVLLMSGELLVADVGGEVRRFSPSGQFLRLEVKHGRGPGEMTEIVKLMPWRDGGVATSWQHYLAVGVKVGPRSPGPITNGPPNSRMLAVLDDGSRVELRMAWRQIGPPTRVLRDTATVVHLQVGGQTTRILKAPFSSALVLVVPAAPGGIRFGQIEGAPGLLMAGRDSSFWYGISDSAQMTRLVVSPQGSLTPSVVRITSHTGARAMAAQFLRTERWTTERITTWREWARQRAQNGADSVLADALWTGQILPASSPIVRSVVVDHDGSLWMEKFPTRPLDLPQFFVLSGKGDLVGRVKLPRPGRILDIREGHVVVGERDADDVERIAVYVLNRGRKK